MKNQEILKLLSQPLPVGHLTKFSYISTEKAQVDEWLINLSLHNMAEISKQVRTTVVEIAHFATDETTRLSLMESVRVAVSNLINSLGKHYLNQSLVLDNKGISIAALVQQLLGYTFATYHAIAERLLSSSSQKKGFGKLFGKLDQKNATLAIHRAITSLHDLICETDLLYLPAFGNSWKNLHQLYIKARDAKLLDAVHGDPNFQYVEKLSIKHVYFRAVLMSISRTNSLRQKEIKKLNGFSEFWCSLLVDNKTPSPNDLFLVDLDSDKPPMYITTDMKLSPNLIYIDAKKLLVHLKGLKTGQATLLHQSEKHLHHTSLIDYISKSIEEPLERNNSRHPFQGKLQIAIGLLSVHYHVAGKKQFDKVINLKQLLKEESSSDILMEKASHFMGDTVSFHQDEEKVSIDKKLLATGEVNILDISPGGYRVEWLGASPQALKTGEIICLKEDDNNPWQVGIIRWVQQKPNEGADFGIEVLATKANVCGVQPSRPEDGRSDFLRGILLPEVKSLNRAATLITPNYHFKSGHRIRIRVGSSDVFAKLGDEHLKTQSFHQYDFTVLPTTNKTLSGY